MILYVSGSFPYSKEGIADGAQFLFDAFAKVYKKEICLLSTNIPVIKRYVLEHEYTNYILLDDWKITYKNTKKIFEILKTTELVHLEYPGDCYGKTFLASWIPFLVKSFNFFHNKNIKICVRLHEFTKSRLLRKIADIPIIMFADLITLPAEADKIAVQQFCFDKDKVRSILMGSDIPVKFNRKKFSESCIQISYFGSVYHNKGIEHLLSIWQRLHLNDTNNLYKFKIIGEINPNNNNHFAEYHKLVMKWIEQYSLKDTVEITGYVSRERASQEIANTDIGMMLFEDGFSLRRGSILPFLEHGIPVVTTKGDSACEAVFKKNAGVYMTENDDEIFSAISELIDCKTRSMVGDENKKVASLFDWNQIARNTLEMYGVPKHDVS